MIPNASAHLFGSQAAGLALPDSDIDIVVLSPEIPDCRVEPDSKFTVIKFMRLVAEAIDAVNPGANIHVEQMISNASVPILKCITQSGRKCDLSFGVQGGLHAAKLMKSEVEATPAVRPILLILKQLLKEKDLNEVYRGGVSSYGLFHMVLCYFSTVNGKVGNGHPTSEIKKSTQKVVVGDGQYPYFSNVSDKSSSCECDAEVDVTMKQEVSKGWAGVCLGRSLLGILKMYGTDLDSRTMAVHARRGLVPKAATRLEVDRRDVGKARLAVVDLLDATHDVASGSFNTPLVLSALAAARSALVSGARHLALRPPCVRL